MTNKDLIALRDAVCDQLLADGWDYDDARFAVMTAVATGRSGVLFEQPEGQADSRLDALREAASGRTAPQPKPSIWTGSDSDLPDFDFDTSVDGTE